MTSPGSPRPYRVNPSLARWPRARAAVRGGPGGPSGPGPSDPARAPGGKGGCCDAGRADPRPRARWRWPRSRPAGYERGRRCARGRRLRGARSGPGRALVPSNAPTLRTSLPDPINPLHPHGWQPTHSRKDSIAPQRMPWTAPGPWETSGHPARACATGKVHKKTQRARLLARSTRKGKGEQNLRTQRKNAAYVNTLTAARGRPVERSFWTSRKGAVSNSGKGERVA